MSKVFGKDSSPSNKPNRNTLDLSFTNHLTTRIGRLDPILVKEVLPGDSVRIDTSFGLRFMPLYFPIQTHMRAYVHYFYVRSRNLWKDWMDFIGNTKSNLVRPYFAGTPLQYNTIFGTGKLGDYLGLPTTVSGTSVTPLWPWNSESSEMSCALSGVSKGLTTLLVNDGSYFSEFEQYFNSKVSSSGIARFASGSLKTTCVGSYPTATNPYSLLYRVAFDFDFDDFVNRFGTSGDNDPYVLQVGFSVGSGVFPNEGLFSGYVSINTSGVNLSTIETTWKKVQYSVGPISNGFRTVTFGISISDFLSLSSPSLSNVSFALLLNPVSFSNVAIPANTPASDGFLRLYFPTPVDISKVPDFTPYGSGLNQISLNCEVARAYEAIYNSFYRDERNNPLIINGEPEYQKFLPTDEGGADSYPYQLHYRNWEQDQFTTAVPSPQQGNAPLVGIESNGVAVFSDPDSGKEYRVQLISEDGENIDSVEYLENVPKSVARSLVNVATSGISINTFRNVNSYQRWLETNIRKGYKYKDQVKGHYGVDVAFNVLDMPEFIGGVSETVQIQQINQNSQSTEESPLGSYAGQAYAIGQSRNRIDKYFDEHGYLIGILCIAPVPSYSQVLPKHFLKRDLLDIYFPEFGQIGYQPIKYSELAPLQVLVSGGDVNETFGYQRPWYDYLSSLDEVHGDFRTNLRDFLINRTFTGKPVLGPDFTVMSDDQLNDIFSVTAPTDKILGQVHFEMMFKRPIPLSGIARLE